MARSTAERAREPAGDGPVTVDGACSAIAAVTITADGLTIRGPMTVTGGHIYELDYLGSPTGAVKGLSLEAGPCRGSLGIFLQDVGALSVSGTTMTGFIAGGAQLLNISDTGGSRLVLDSNDVSGGSYGILLQNVSPGTVELLGNRLRGSTFAGIKLENSGGVLIGRNTASNDGIAGIALDDRSNGNHVVRNVALGNTFDLSNKGQHNCFRQNRYTTSQGVIGCGTS
jgi:parallel beta-helix repeat protein